MTQPKLQLALDMPDLQLALDVLKQVHNHIDIIEVGTLLCLSEGLTAIRSIRSAYPNHIIVGDVRIVRAGSKIADMVFDAGADLVTVVAEAPLSTLEATHTVAQEYGKEVQVELGEILEESQIEKWQKLGIQHIIYHSETEVLETGVKQWSRQSLDIVRQLCDFGFCVTATGGIEPETVSMFLGIPLDIIIAGRAIWNAENPLERAGALKSAIEHIYG